MSGRSGGRHIGRTGPRIGLPIEPTRSDGRADMRAGVLGGWSRDPAVGRDPRRGGDGAWMPGSPDEPTAARRADRLSITQLFEHMEPRARSYRGDAYEDAPKIAHSATARRSAASFATAGALIGGAAMSVLIVFVAGFLSAVLIFGEPDEGGDLAIRTAPATPSLAAQSSPQVQPVAPSRSTVVPSATAAREVLPAPAPEIAAAEAARQSALSSGQLATAVAGGPVEPVATTGANGTSVIAPPASGDLGRSDTSGVVVTDSIIFPPSKPAEPPRQTASISPASGVLSAPSGNYSLQFGAFRDRANAEALVREITPVAQGGIAEEAGVSGNVLYYVRAGSFRTRAEALEAVRDLRERTGIVTFVHANRGSG